MTAREGKSARFAKPTRSAVTYRASIREDGTWCIKVVETWRRANGRVAGRRTRRLGRNSFPTYRTAALQCDRLIDARRTERSLRRPAPPAPIALHPA